MNICMLEYIPYSQNMDAYMLENKWLVCSYDSHMDSDINEINRHS